MKFPGFVLGYHGCDQATAEKVLAGSEEVRASTNSYDWLGSGAYFWENNPSRAYAWARFLAQRGDGKIKKPAVVGVIIDPGNCLDLAEKSSLDLVKQAYEDYVLVGTAENVPLPTNEKGFSGDLDFVKRHLDCAVLNFLHDLREFLDHPPFDTIRAPFLEGGDLFPGSKLAAKSHVQWCVREPRRNIIAYFRPRDLDPIGS